MLSRRRLLQSGLAAGGLGLARCVSAQALPGEWVPMQMLRTGDIGALPVVECVLGGVPTHWLVDSGSTTALISPELAARLRLRRLEPVRVATAGGTQTVDRFELPPMPLPGPTGLGAGALALDLGALFGPAGLQIDGLIGAPWLRAGVTTLEFARGRLRWSAEAGPVPAGAVVLPLRWDGGLPVLKLALGARAAEDFLFDTGNAGALVIFARRAAALLAEAGTLPEVTVRELGGTVKARHARIERLAAADLVWTDVPAALESGAAARRGAHFDRLAGSLGVALFEAGAVTVDGVASRLVVESPGLPTPPPLPGGFGLLLGEPGSAGLKVQAVIDGGPAAEAGIAAGDTVTAIDGASARHWAASDAWRTLAGRDAAEWTVARGAATQRRVPLQRQRFFPLLR